jgi:hypothetical protein
VLAEAPTVVPTDKPPVDLLPKESAAGLSFVDTQTEGSKIDGDIKISKASKESFLTADVVYWGSDTTTKLDRRKAIATLAKSGSNLTYSIPMNSSIPLGATHHLVKTKNSGGEMLTGIGFAIEDMGVPSEAAIGTSFGDTSAAAGKLSGTETITKAATEYSLTDYVLCCGSDASTKLANGAPLATLAKGSGLTISFPAIATQLLVRSKNACADPET